MDIQREDQIAGCLLGTAIGDTIGLPLENLSRRRIDAWLGDGKLGHRFLFGKGMVSDDTEHSCLVGQSLALFAHDSERFGKDLARRLRWWFAGGPAGSGRATLRSCTKLWLGFGYKKSGVWSAGNGPAMRAAIIGVAIADRNRATELVEICSRITHSDPKAVYGGLAVAALAHHFAFGDKNDVSPETLLLVCRQWVCPRDESTDDAADEFIKLLTAAATSASAGQSTLQFAESMGWEKGVSGYTYHTVPAAIHAVMRYTDDYRLAIEQLIRCGGDVDSTAAIAGGILGVRLGPNALPNDWLNGIIEWPRTKSWMCQLAGAMAISPACVDPPASLVNHPVDRIPTVNVFAQYIRNGFFSIVVLVHALRRLLPPY